MKYQEISTFCDEASLAECQSISKSIYVPKHYIYTPEGEQELYVPLPQVLKTEEGARAWRREEGMSLVLIHITALERL